MCHSNTDIHAPGGTGTHNPSKRAAADPRLRPRGHWDRRGLLTSLIYGFVQTMLYYHSVLKENNFPAVLVESLHILFVCNFLNYRMYNIIVLCSACVIFPVLTPCILKQTVIFALLIQTNSPFISTLQAMTLLTSNRKVPIPNPLYELNIWRCFVAQVCFSCPTPGHYLKLGHDHLHLRNFQSFSVQYL
jgi:hypothetical protein